MTPVSHHYITIVLSFIIIYYQRLSTFSLWSNMKQYEAWWLHNMLHMACYAMLIVTLVGPTSHPQKVPRLSSRSLVHHRPPNTMRCSVAVSVTSWHHGTGDPWGPMGTSLSQGIVVRCCFEMLFWDVVVRCCEATPKRGDTIPEKRWAKKSAQEKTQRVTSGFLKPGCATIQT